METQHSHILSNQRADTKEMAPSGTTFSPSSPPNEPMTKRSSHPGYDRVHGTRFGTVKVTSAQTMEMEYHYSAHNYHPLPVVFARAQGAKVWDPEGREYLDFLSACTCQHLVDIH